MTCTDHLSYHRCFICLKPACHVYYSYLRQPLHGRVTTEVNIAKMRNRAYNSMSYTVKRIPAYSVSV